MVPTVVDNLFSQGTIAADSLGIFYEPTTQEGAINGELTFGGVDMSKYAMRYLTMRGCMLICAFAGPPVT